jgi:two-component system phosphate regulon sensor histidine kinase PhoR
MRDTLSFRARLMAAFIVVILMALLPPAWYARHIFTTEVQESAKTDARRELGLVVMLLEAKGSFTSTEDLRVWVNDLGDKLGVRLTYIGHDGEVLADSHIPDPMIADMEDHAGRPEVTALSEQDFGTSIRFSDTVQKNLIYAATRAPELDGVPAGTLRLAKQFADVDRRMDQQAWQLLLVLAAALGLAAILSYVLVRSLSRPLAEMVNVAKDIGEGEYQRRLRIHPGKEFHRLAEAINTMAANIDSQIETITWQNEQLEAMLNGMREGVMVLDREGRINSVNKNMELIFPGAMEAQGKRPLELTMLPEFDEACEKALTETTRQNISLQIEPSPGRVYDVNVVSLRGDRHGLGVIAVFHDISEIKRLERVRQDFVANVSHELRTPLTTVKGYAETILNGPPAKQEILNNFLEIILKNADHMTKMIEDLLSLSRLERGQERFLKMHVNAASAVVEAYRACSSLAEEKNIELVRDLPEGKILVEADYDRLVQVFRNLLENAFKYAPAETQVLVTSEHTGPEIKFSVEDTGPGIPRNERDRIFERFYRVEKHRNRNGSASSGLGLAICKHIVERMGGRIWVESPAAGKESGSVFSFTLPASPENARPNSDEIEEA